MRIESDDTMFGDGKWPLVRIATDNGIVGVGESGLHGVPEAALSAINAFSRYLVGKDPLRIEHHFQYLYRYSHFRGAAIGGALNAIDIALWDIAGKHYGAPAYQLLGGKVRDRVRLYMHVGHRTFEDGLLGTLAIPFAYLGDFAKAAPAFCRFYIHVVRNQHPHDRTP